jgi:hypothetical protein
MNKFVKVLGLMVLAIGVLSACSEQTVEKGKTSDAVQQKMDESKAEPAEKQAPQKEAPKEIIAKLGETLDVGGVKITVTSIEPFAGEINQFQPLKQNHAVMIGVIVENDTTEQVFVDSSEFKLYDKDGFEVSSALPSDEMALSGEIPGGKKVQGAIYFDVPKQDGAAWEIQYESIASFDGEPAKWEIPAK